MSKSDVPLSPEDETFIRNSIAGFEPGPSRDRLERDIRKKVQKQANAAGADRIVQRDARAYADRLGMRDPDAYVAQAKCLAQKERQFEQRQAANAARAKARLRRMADRARDGVEKASKSAQPDMRRLAQADRKYVTALGEAEKAGLDFHGSLVTSKLKIILGAYRLPHWDKTTTSLKVMALSVESARRGARTINLRMNAETCRVALQSPRGPGSFMQDRIRKHLKQEFGEAPEFWFVVERDTKERFHLHGAVVCNPHDEDVHRRVDQALERAGGAWTKAKAGRLFQQRSRSLDDPFLWAGYVVKDINLTSLDVDRKLLASTAEIRASVRGSWDTLRSSLPRV